MRANAKKSHRLIFETTIILVKIIEGRREELHTTHKEFLAVDWAFLLHSRPEKRTIKYTDGHNVLQWILDLSEALGKLLQSQLQMSEL